MKIGFVILHYLTDKDTIQCIESIIDNYKNEDYHIVIVDNFSNNGSIEKVEKNFKYNNKITIIKNDENLGFAKGNNVGYRYCKENLRCEYIAILNNDIIIENNMVKIIEKDYSEYNCALIGPDIKSIADGGHQNPMLEVKVTKKWIYKEILRYRILYILNEINLYDKMKKRDNTSEKINKKFIDVKKENVQLHGAFIIFTPIFIKKMKNAFCDETFLYLEEIILKKICNNMNFKTLYDPNIKVLHREDSSTNVLCNKPKIKRKFVFINLIKSYKVLMKYI